MTKPYMPDPEIDEAPGRADTGGVSTFDLRIKFNMAIANRAGTTKMVREKFQLPVEYWISIAEDLFDRSPALKITPIWNWNVPRTGLLQDNQLEFVNERSYHKWMDDNYDTNVGDHKTQGSFQVLFVDNFSLKSDSTNGAAFLPQRIAGRKHGIVCEYRETPTRRAGKPQMVFEGMLAHELGHVFGLRHTFKTEADQGSTRRSDGSINLMDYWTAQKPASAFFLDPDQHKRAAAQRRRYMTKDGDVDYRALRRNW